MEGAGAFRGVAGVASLERDCVLGGWGVGGKGEGEAGQGFSTDAKLGVRIESRVAGEGVRWGERMGACRGFSTSAREGCSGLW